MEIKFYDSISDFQELKERCWSGALQVLERVEEKGLEDLLMNLLQDLSIEDNIWEDITAINDFIWFDLENWDGFRNLWSNEEESEEEAEGESND